MNGKSPQTLMLDVDAKLDDLYNAAGNATVAFNKLCHVMHNVFDQLEAARERIKELEDEDD